MDLRMSIQLAKNVWSRLVSIFTVLPQHPEMELYHPDLLSRKDMFPSCQEWGTTACSCCPCRSCLSCRAALPKITPFPCGPHLTTSHSRGRSPSHFVLCKQSWVLSFPWFQVRLVRPHCSATSPLPHPAFLLSCPQGPILHKYPDHSAPCQRLLPEEPKPWHTGTGAWGSGGMEMVVLEPLTSWVLDKSDNKNDNVTILTLPSPPASPSSFRELFL